MFCFLNIDSVLSAEAPEFVPQFHKQAVVISPDMSGNIGPPIIQHQGIPVQPQLIQQQQQHPFTHHNQAQVNHPTMINHNQIRHHQNHHQHHHPHYQPNQHHQKINNSHYSVNNRLQFNGVASNTHRYFN